MANKKTSLISLSHKDDKEAPDLTTGLRPKEETFALLLATNQNLVECYTEAGYAGATYEETLKLARDLASNDLVRAVAIRQAEYNKKRYANESRRVIQELESLAYSSVNDFYVDGDQLKLKPGVDPRAWSAVLSVKNTMTENIRTGDVSTKVEFIINNKIPALKMLADHFGLLESKMPPLDVLLARLPTEVANYLREILAESTSQEHHEGVIVNEALVDELPENKS